jgi:fatty acyl-CoA reductase
MDLVALTIGKKMLYRRAYQKTEKILIIMSFFGLREWKVGNKNVQAMLEKSKTFRNHLDFDMRNVNWSEYFRTFIPGIKKYFFKENANSARLAAQYQW